MQKVVLLSVHPLYDTRIFNHAHTLSKYGCELTYINQSPDDYAWPLSHDDHVTLVHRTKSQVFGTNVFRYLDYLRWCFFEARRARPDLVHIHDLPLLPLVPFLKYGLGSKVVFDVHEYFSQMPGFFGTIAKLYYQLFYPLLDGAVGVCRDVLPSENVPYKIVPNYQRSEVFQSDDTPSDLLTIIYFGSLDTHDRDVELMINIAWLLLRAHPTIGFQIAGKLRGPKSENYDAQLTELSQEFGSRFEWLHEIPQGEVFERTARADIGIWFLKEEVPNASPNKIFQYLAAGLGIVATDGFSIAERVRETGSGITVPAGISAEDLVKRMEGLLGNQKELEIMKKASSTLGVEYTWESVATNYIELYRELGVILEPSNSSR